MHSLRRRDTRAVRQLTLRVVVLGIVAVGSITSPAAAGSPNAYIANTADGTVSVVNTNGNAVKKTIGPPSGNNPVGVAVAPGGQRIYVTDLGPDPSLTAIDGRTNKIIETVSLPDGDAWGVAVNPAGTRVYVMHQSGSLSVLDATTSPMTLIGNFPIGSIEGAVGVVSPDGTRLYMTSSQNGFPYALSVLDTSNNNVVGQVDLNGLYPAAIAVSPDGSKVYVTGEHPSIAMDVIDTETLTLTTTVSCPDPPGCLARGVAVKPDGSQIYVASDNGPLVIDSTTYNLSYMQDLADPDTCMNVPGGNIPWAVSVTPNGKRVYVTDEGNDSVFAIDLASYCVIKEIPVGAGPQAVGQFIDASPYSLSGRVKAAVKGAIVPLPTATVILSRPGRADSAVSDNKGKYSIPHLPGGVYTLTPTLTGCSFTPPSATITIQRKNTRAPTFVGACP